MPVTEEFPVQNSRLDLRNTIMYIWNILMFNWTKIITITEILLYNYLPSSKGNKCNTLKHISKGLEFWYFYVLQTGEVGCGSCQVPY